MIKKIEKELKMIRYANGLKLSVVAIFIFLMVGILYQFSSNMRLFGDYFIAITAINAVQVVFSLNVSGLIASSAHKKSMQTVLPAMVCFGVSIITYLILGIKNLILYKAGSMDMQQLSGGMLYEAVLILVFMLYTAFCYKIFYIATAGFLIIFFATYIGMGAMNGTALYIFSLNLPVNLTFPAGILIVIVGGILQYLIFRLLYKLPISKNSQYSSIRKCM